MALKLQQNRLFSEFSTFGIGGNLKYFLEVATPLEMEEAFLFSLEKKLPILILGRGSNCLFPDEGFEGVAILNKIDFCTFEGSTVRVGAGFPFSLLGVQSARRGLSGLEFASGIPATVGGAIYMNAGANGNETSKSLHSVHYLHKSGKEAVYLKEDLEFAYRTSPFQKMEGAILFATFHLTPEKEARQNQLKIIQYRMTTQPLKEKSAGCIFRNPSKEISAGAIIDRAGLKGMRVGEAKVSELHANFIVNMGGAKASDVKELISLIQRKVYEQTRIQLEPEIQIFS